MNLLKSTFVVIAVLLFQVLSSSVYGQVVADYIGHEKLLGALPPQAVADYVRARTLGVRRDQLASVRAWLAAWRNKIPEPQRTTIELDWSWVLAGGGTSPSCLFESRPMTEEEKQIISDERQKNPKLAKAIIALNSTPASEGLKRRKKTKVVVASDFDFRRKLPTVYQPQRSTDYEEKASSLREAKMVLLTISPKQGLSLEQTKDASVKTGEVENSLADTAGSHDTKSKPRK
jgi:hypothetical protein